MKYLRKGRVSVFLALVVGLAAGGIAYASIPGPDGVIHSCYLKSGGALRVIDSTGKCKSTETSLNWNQKGATGAKGATGPSGASGPTGPTGPARAAGPTLVLSGAAVVPSSSTQPVISHTVTASEAGLTILTEYLEVFDTDGTSGGTTTVFCLPAINGGGGATAVRVSDNGSQSFGDTSSNTNVRRVTLKTGDVVSVSCEAPFNNDGGEANAQVDLVFEHVSS